MLRQRFSGAKRLKNISLADAGMGIGKVFDSFRTAVARNPQFFTDTTGTTTDPTVTFQEFRRAGQRGAYSPKSLDNDSDNPSFAQTEKLANQTKK
jgi:hypothetical protein